MQYPGSAKSSGKQTTQPTEDELQVWASAPASFARYCSGGRWYPAKHLVELSHKLMDVAAGDINHLMIFMPPRHGKQIADSTPVPTADGWKKHGDLAVGDYVFHPSGELIRVVAKSDKTPSNYVVDFTNGQSIRCHGNHEWNVYSRPLGRWVTMCTEKLHGLKLTSGVMGKRGGRYTYQLQNISPLKYRESNLPIPPYVLGAWLGDGSRTKPCITHDKKDVAIIDRIAMHGYDVSATCVHNITGVHTTYFGGKRGVGGRLINELKAIGLIGAKFIPSEYIFSSVEQRLELLAGLVDTDGYCNDDGRIIFTSADKKLIDGVFEICTSLGFRPYIQNVQPTTSSSGIVGKKEYWTVGFNPTVPIPCALERKKCKRLIKQRRVAISNIRYDPNGETGHCIQVDSPDGMYLVGDHLIPTHNSELTSKYFPAWYLGKYPDNRVILTGYEADFAAQWGYKARNIMHEHGPALFNLTVAGNSSARDRWDIAGHLGGMSTAGVGGAITGKGAHLLIIDDPIKNAEEANSKTYRDKSYDWYRSTAYTRKEPGGSVVIIQTRWHEDDLSGRLLKEEPEKWTVINLPALAEEEGDQLGRQPGEALFPKRYDVPALQQIKRTVGSYWWDALYQQRPAAPEGAIFKRQYFQYCHIEDGLYVLRDKRVKYYDCTIYQTCDPAVSTKASADYFVLATWAVTPDQDLILLDIMRTRLEGPDQINLFKQQYSRWKPAYQGIEAVGVGKTLYQMLVREGLPIRELKAESDKVTRALPAAARMESGSVYFMRELPGLDEFEEELLSFPKGKHDDQVDCLSYAVQLALQQYQDFDLDMLIKTFPR